MQENNEERFKLWRKEIPEADLENGDSRQTFASKRMLDFVDLKVGQALTVSGLGTLPPDTKDLTHSTDTNQDSLSFESTHKWKGPNLNKTCPDSEENVAPAHNLIGQNVNHDKAAGYQVTEEIGRGGMGVVYAAEQTSLEREVAIKTLFGNISEQNNKRFIAEARVTAYLDHPNIVPVHELGVSPNGQIMMTMKRVGGKTWQDLLKAGTKPETKNGSNFNESPTTHSTDLLTHLQVLISVCNAIALAHSKGIAHLDLKPENIIVGEFGEVLVMDWGIAVDFRSKTERKKAGGKIRAFPKESIQSPCGTPSYMAPELVDGIAEMIGPHTDIYLLGAILHEILTGEPPHKGRNLMATLLAASQGVTPSFPSDTPRELANLCCKALAKNPLDRFESVQSFQAAINIYLSHRESSHISNSARELLFSCESQTSAVEKSESQTTKEKSQVLSDFAEAVNGFKQALTLWPGNPEAREYASKAHYSYARTALSFGDIALAETQLSSVKDAESNQFLSKAISAKIRRRRQTQIASKSLKWVIMAAIAFSVLGFSNYVLNMTNEKILTMEKAALADAKASEARKEAKRADTKAREATAQAVRADKNATLANQEAKRAKDRVSIADKALKVLVYEVRD
ncbi:MAG: protein kinase, partial [Planctomycetota bacterium]|nr:protein kinase [Planctomycetota bacterium]